MGRVRPGLTLIELLVAIVFFGLMGALLLPRLAPVQGQEAASAPAPDDGSTACLPAYHPFVDGMCPRQYGEPYVGIGAVLNIELNSDGYVLIDRPFSGSPAEEAGIEPGDVIQQVDGVSVQDESVGRVASMIRNGSMGSSVELTVGRSGSDQPLDVTVTRRCIHPPAPFDQASE
jgi:membrane-associated protease RseP (regulator of RpoE activity)